MSSFDSTLFTIVPVFVVIIFIFVIVIIAVTFATSTAQWRRNNLSPRLTVPAKIVTKRVDTRHTHPANDSFPNTSTSTYFITFEFDSGDRQEFTVQGEDYGLLAEGDTGRLTFQGKRFLSFERTQA